MQKQPICYFLIGVPASGKSTYAAKLGNDFNMISTDAYIERAAEQAGMCYGDAFSANIADATTWMTNQLADNIAHKKNIVWDQTNLAIKSRKSKLNKLLAAGYRVVAVAFEISNDELARRAQLRATLTGKVIPERIVNSMLTQYVRPTIEEGFDEIIVIGDSGEK